MSRTRRQRKRLFWMAVLVAVVVVITFAGLSSDDIPEGIITTNYGPARTSWTYKGEEVTKEQWEVLRGIGLKRVSKFIEAGIIQRINEAKRQLFINDPVWYAMSVDRQEHVARVVVGYLDVVNENNPGTVGVFSFRTGGSIAGINGGTYTVYR